MKRVAILISGRGSNMQALLDAQLPAEINAVISNEPQAAGLEIARARGVKVEVLGHREFADRAGFEHKLAEMLTRYEPHLVVLAGFMRILGQEFLNSFSGKLINIHPSLLPAFPGIDTHRRVLEAGVRIHGCTVHFVTSSVDNGPIILQAAVPVHLHDTEASLAARVLAEEHRILPQAVRWFLEERLIIRDNQVVVRGECRYPNPIISPLSE